MELWEGAILVVGGIWLVGHMASKNAAVQATAAAAATGVSNQSNLTNITNTAGGDPTIAGEPLTPSNPPLLGGPPIAVTMPPTGVAQVSSPAAPLARPVHPGLGAGQLPFVGRPMQMHL